MRAGAAGGNTSYSLMAHGVFIEKKSMSGVSLDCSECGSTNTLHNSKDLDYELRTVPTVVLLSIPFLLIAIRALLSDIPLLSDFSCALHHREASDGEILGNHIQDSEDKVSIYFNSDSNNEEAFTKLSHSSS
jgi:hypothetical protein